MLWTILWIKNAHQSVQSLNLDFSFKSKKHSQDQERASRVWKVDIGIQITKMISEWLIKTRLLFECTFHLQNMYQDSIFDLTVDPTSCSWNCCCRSSRKHWITMPFWRGCKYWQKCVEGGRGMILQIKLRQWVSLWTFWRLMAGTPRHPRTLLILHAAPGNVAAQDPGDNHNFCPERM